MTPDRWQQINRVLEGALGRARRALGAHEAEHALSEGRALAFQQAVDYALTPEVGP
jgi:hypothetical protein